MIFKLTTTVIDVQPAKPEELTQGYKCKASLVVQDRQYGQKITRTLIARSRVALELGEQEVEVDYSSYVGKKGFGENCEVLRKVDGGKK